MHIKKIIIQGFKTYRNTTEIDLLSPNFNVVVGRNGSGKSNFFAAIRFVLSDAYSHMTREERQGLIHEGSGTVMSAFVEIVFDNTDRRFPIQRDEIAVRRTIGLKKDDYSLDGKSATRSDIMNLLESAGFSKLNPYYIVPQGQITSLTNSKDAERLSLLKEVSGAKMFESKLRESNREMTNSNYKMERIDEAMEKLEDKLSDLQIELDDLKEYQQLEKSRKIFEFNLFDRELTTVSKQSEEKESEYETLLESSQKDIKNLEDRERTCQKVQLNIDELTAAIKIAQLDEAQCDADQTRNLQTIAEKEVQERELASSLGSDLESVENRRLKQATYFEAIQRNENLLESTLKPNMNQLQTTERDLKDKIMELTTKQNMLYAKQSRFLKFTTKKQRDKWLQQEIRNLQEDKTTKNNKLQASSVKKEELDSQLLECNRRLDELRIALDDPQNVEIVHQLEEEVREGKYRVSNLLDQRKAFWRQEMRIRSLQDSTEHELSNINHKVVQTMDRAQAKGLESVREIAEKLNLQSSVYGPLVDLFSVSEKYKTAVEVVAGNSLFHVVVDTDETALTLMKELARTKAGRVTFMPINRIHVPPISFPDQEAHEFIPLIKKLKHNADLVGKAIQQVFGRTIVCKSLHRGSELARLYNLNAITLDGDIASTKGVLSGGFREFKNSRIDNLRLQSKKRVELKKLQEEVQECSREIEALTHQLADANNQLDSKLKELQAQSSKMEPIRVEHTRLLNEKFRAQKEIDVLEMTVRNLSLANASIDAKLQQYQNEKESSFSQALSPEEAEEISSLAQEIATVENEYNSAVGDATELETQIAEVEDKLATLRAQMDQVSQSSAFSDRNGQEMELQILREELGTLREKSSELKEQHIEYVDKVSDISEKLEAKKRELAKADEEQVATLKRLEGVGKRAERILSKKAILDSRRDELQEKVHELGVLPEEAFQLLNFETLLSDSLLANLNSVNNELKKYAHINKKAMEQLSTFAKEKEDLVSRKEELEQSKESIEQLVESLKLQKDAAIKSSFEEVSRSFSEIFEKLVPNGRGELVMRTKDDIDDEEGSQSIENYTGVAILVSFNSKEDEQQRIEQLSGGQKSLCAIALILAIQKCDPAPFYLFDEIDANLDTQYRTAVAALIETLAINAQFICTTFRPEMLQAANTFYGVSFSNKVSTVLEITQDEALSFVEGQRS